MSDADKKACLSVYPDAYVVSQPNRGSGKGRRYHIRVPDQPGFSKVIAEGSTASKAWHNLVKR